MNRGNPTAAGVVQPADYNDLSDSPLSPTALLPVGSTIVVLLIGMMVVVVGVVSCQTWRKSTVDDQKPADNNAVDNVPELSNFVQLSSVRNPLPPPTSSQGRFNTVDTLCCRPRGVCRRRRLHLAAATVYLVVKLSYSIVVTFTVASVFVGFHFRAAIEPIGSGGPVLTDYARGVTAEVDRAACDHLRERGDGLERMVLDAGRACISHVDEIARRLRTAVLHESVSAVVGGVDDRSISVYGVMSQLVGSTSDRLVDAMKLFVNEVTNTVDIMTTNTIQRYRAFLVRASDNQWTTFGRALFNRSIILSLDPPRECCRMFLSDFMKTISFQFIH